MGITYEQLVNLNLSKLDEAIEDWRAAKRRAAELKADAREGLGKNFRAAGWESSDGTSASAAKQVKDIEEEFEDAHQVCNAVLGVLGEAKQELAAKKRKLTDLVAAEEAGGDVTVSPTGKVRFNSLAPRADLVRKDDAGQERVDAVVEKIEKVLDEAAEVDDSASAAIRYNIGNEREEFHDHTAARTDDAEARYDSAAAVKLASKGPEMSESELREYNSLLKEHRGDKSFARQFAIRMGPDGVQKFWGRAGTRLALLAVTFGIVAVAGCSTGGEQKNIRYALPEKLCGSDVPKRLYKPLFPGGDRLIVDGGESKSGALGEGDPGTKCAYAVDGRTFFMAFDQWFAEGPDLEERMVDWKSYPRDTYKVDASKSVAWNRREAMGVVSCRGLERELIGGKSKAFSVQALFIATLSQKKADKVVPPLMRKLTVAVAEDEGCKDVKLASGG